MTERDDKAGALQRVAGWTEGFVCFESFPEALHALHALHAFSLSRYLAISLSRYLGSVTKTENHLTIRAERI